MASRIRFYPYKLGGNGVKALSTALDSLQVKADGKYAPQPDDVVVNWGNSRRPNWNPKGPKVFLNPCEAIEIAANKISTFRRLDEKGVNTLYWTTNAAVATQWMNEGYTVFARSKVNGHGGDGITTMVSGDTFPSDAKFFTRYENNKLEYRVHIFRNEVIDIVQKKKMNETTIKERGITPNELVKNHDNGYVFARNDLRLTREVREAITEESIKAIAALGLDFGAVDVLYSDRAIILEVNTAPGLEGTTLEHYIATFRRFYEQA